MTIGITPTITLNLDSINLTELKSIYITFRQSDCLITKNNEDEGVIVSEHTVTVTLSQEETLKLTPGIVEMQLKGLAKDGTVFATNIRRIDVNEALLKEVIT